MFVLQRQISLLCFNDSENAMGHTLCKKDTWINGFFLDSSSGFLLYLNMGITRHYSKVMRHKAL